MTTAANKISANNPMLTIGHVAAMLGCSRRSVGRYESQGLASVTRLDGTGKRFYLREVQRFVRVKYVKATVIIESKNTKGVTEDARMHRTLSA